MNRWLEYFEELLNRPVPTDPPDFQPAEIELNINCEIPSTEEIREAIKIMKDGNAAGLDGISAEAKKDQCKHLN